MFLASFNTDAFKYVLIVATFPVWMPFLKALYAEMNDALATEGGLFGRPPTKREVELIAKDHFRSKSPLVSHDFDPEDKGARAGGQASPPAQASAPAKSARGAPPKIGFSKPRGVRGFARKDQRSS